MWLEEMQSDIEFGYDLVRAKRAHMHVPAVGIPPHHKKQGSWLILIGHAVRMGRVPNGYGRSSKTGVHCENAKATCRALAQQPISCF